MLITAMGFIVSLNGASNWNLYSTRKDDRISVNSEYLLHLRDATMSAAFLVSQFLIISFPFLCSARYDAYVSSDGGKNPSCSQSAPCGLFQFVLQNIAIGAIPNEDLYIHINGSNPAIGVNGNCGETLTGNITFILDPNSITTLSDWFGAGVLNSCQSASCGLFQRCSYHFITVAEGSNVAFYHLVWDSGFPFLRSFEKSTFHCEHCLIHSKADDTLFLLSNKATFTDCIFLQIISESTFELFPITEFDETLGPQNTDTLLTLTGCSVSSNFSSFSSTSTFIKVEVSTGMFHAYLLCKYYSVPLANSRGLCEIGLCSTLLVQSCDSLLCKMFKIRIRKIGYHRKQ